MTNKLDTSLEEGSATPQPDLAIPTEAGPEAGPETGTIHALTKGKIADALPEDNKATVARILGITPREVGDVLMVEIPQTLSYEGGRRLEAGIERPEIQGLPLFFDFPSSQSSEEAELTNKLKIAIDENPNWDSDVYFD